MTGAETRIFFFGLVLDYLAGHYEEAQSLLEMAAMFIPLSAAELIGLLY